MAHFPHDDACIHEIDRKPARSLTTNSSSSLVPLASKPLFPVRYPPILPFLAQYNYVFGESGLEFVAEGIVRHEKSWVMVLTRISSKPNIKKFKRSASTRRRLTTSERRPTSVSDGTWGMFGC